MIEKEETKSNIINYPVTKEGKIVSKHQGLARLTPKLDAPPPTQPGSVDWTMTYLFGSTNEAIEMIESLVAGQGDNAEEKWVKVVVLYRQWELDYKDGKLESPPTLNAVTHSLGFDSRDFITQLQTGIKLMMTSMVHTQAALAAPQVMKAVIARSQTIDGTKDSELALKIAGVIDEKGGPNIQINNTNQNAVLLKSEKDKLRTPLLQFKDTVDAIDDEARE